MSVRTSGLLKVIASGVLVAIIFSTVLNNGLGNPAHGGPFKLVAMGIPGAFALVGLIELLTGIAFTRIAEKWDALQGWQRGVLGVLVAVFSFILMMAGVVIFA